mgnify:CR=1 FL=1
MESLNVNAKNWKALIKPAQLDVKINDDKSHAKIVAEPLEKGYGLTLGNSLRRILLSSIRGAAVTSIQIDGVLHEFTSIKGVREDVTDIVLNVKSLALKSSSESTKKLILDAKGPGEIKASDITPVTDIEILNPDLVICNLDENTHFHMEMNVGTGKGYVPAVMNKPEEPPLGLIAIDSLYSPVKKVSFSVSTAREGKALDYDKLTMEVETKTPITGEDRTFSVDLRQLLNKLVVNEYVSAFTTSDMTINVRPLTYREFTDASLKTFEEQRIFALVEDEKISDNEKLSKFNDSFQKLTKLTISTISKSITSIVDGDDEVTNPQHIEEFINNADKQFYNDVLSHIEKQRDTFQLEPLKVQSTDEDVAAGAPKTWEVPITFDQSNFFA